MDTNEVTQKPLNRMVLNRDVLKYLAAVCMLYGHYISLIMRIPNYPQPLIRLAGRIVYIAPPIFIFFVAEGYRYTRNVKKYLLRLGICAAVTQAIMIWGDNASWWDGNLIIAFFFGVLALVIWEQKWKLPVRILLMALCIVMTYHNEYSLVIPLYLMLFYFLKDKPWLRLLGFEILTFLFELYAFNFTLDQFFWNFFGAFTVSMFLITFFYNGKKGSHSKFNKYFFYVFYPAHFLVYFILMRYIL